jgi:hypothetical protein
MIWGHPPPPLQASVDELYTQGVERQGRGKPFRTGKGVGGPKSCYSTETLVLYILYSIYEYSTLQEYRGRILGRNPDKNDFLLAIHSHLYRFALRYLFLKTYATSYVFLETHATSYLFSAVHCKGERTRRKT